ncbi:asparagine synthase (glutamine-hydrolyzing) [Candidatus Woesearchaeota archaeon]|nr:asparagine synthase (glutamine-hydrolyzing) [Candidatus Woesearchaeota archaeon]
MCGINGITGTDRKGVARMNAAIRHRGPDDEGIEAREGITLGHVRLAILDLSPKGHQPMHYGRAGGAASARHRRSAVTACMVSIVYNGEVYNYLELKEELLGKGYSFSTGTDTEVILAAYLEWGFSCVERFNGMWAFAIHDRSKCILFCSRDRLGQKPFYYTAEGGGFAFSSEPKGLLARRADGRAAPGMIDWEAAEFYFSLGFIPAPYCIYRGMRKLEPRHNIVFDLKTGRTRTWQYYDVPRYRPSRDREALVAEGRRLLADSVRLRMRADVPVGAYLSGGLDSSSVVGLMRDQTDLARLHTYSVGFEGKYDESAYMRIVKDRFGTRHHHLRFREKDLAGLEAGMQEVLDEPFADYSAYPQYAISRLAKNDVTVILSGDGGDEVFAGYPRHQVACYLSLARTFVPRLLRRLAAWTLGLAKPEADLTLLGKAREFFRLSLAPEHEYLYASLRRYRYLTPAIERWHRTHFAELRRRSPFVEAVVRFDLLYATLPRFLEKVDRVSMTHALETRSPFLDYRLVGYAARIPVRWKLGPLAGKKLLRNISSRIVPREILRRGKMGFTPPLAEWIDHPALARTAAEALAVLERRHPALARHHRENIMGRDDELARIGRIRLFLFALWHRRWISAPSAS